MTMAPCSPAHFLALLLAQGPCWLLLVHIGLSHLLGTCQVSVNPILQGAQGVAYSGSVKAAVHSHLLSNSDFVRTSYMLQFSPSCHSLCSGED
jgi:hypothetical protein